MGMYRKITKVLEGWKGDPEKVALIVEGPRQVGKTYVIREFGKGYEHYLELNLIADRGVRGIFSGNIDAETVKRNLRMLHPEFEFVRGRSLLFLDEVQDCPDAIEAIKFLVDDGSMDVIASGSMLGIQYRSPRSYPVGYVSTVRMHPMDFEEFLIAKGIDGAIIDSIRDSISKRKPFDSFILKTMNDAFREYMQVGGMPRAVSFYLDGSKGIGKVYGVHDDVIQAYRKDITSYAPKKYVGDVIEAFDSIPAELGRQSKRFRFSDVSDGRQGRYTSFKGPLDWIRGSRFIEVCCCLRNIEHPLGSQVDARKFKAYMADTGLLMQMYGMGARQAVMNGDMAVNEGAMTENIVLQMLTSSGHSVYYFEKNSSSDEGGAFDFGEGTCQAMRPPEERIRMEIDFVTSFGADIVAIEVKSGKKRKAKSLNALRETVYGRNVKRFIRFANSNISVDELGVEHYPLFCAAFTDAMSVSEGFGRFM